MSEKISRRRNKQLSDMEITDDIKEALRRAQDTKALEEGPGALSRIPRMFKSLFPGRTAIIVTDSITFGIAGEAVQRYLQEGGVSVAEPFIFTDKGLFAEWTYVEQLEAGLKDRDVIPIAVGAGVINDLTKLVSHRLGRRYMTVCTAASMDGYIAFGASITFEGNKQTFDCRAPLGIVLDPVIAAKAPKSMTASGYGDLMAKIPSGADWIVADAVGSEPIDPFVFSLVQKNLRKALSAPDAVAAGDVEAVSRLADEMIMSGFAMQAISSSRPASGAEHLFSHFWDMEGLSFGGRHVSHGFMVAIGSLVTTSCYEFLLSKDLSTLDIDAAAAAWPEWAEMERHICNVFDGKPVHLQRGLTESREKYIDRDGIRMQLSRVRNCWTELSGRLRNQLMPVDQMRDFLRRAGAPYEPEMIGVSREKLRSTFRCIPFMRDRFTGIDLIYRAGLLDEAENALFGPGARWEI